MKKRYKFCFFLYVIVCILWICVSAGKREEEILTETYGNLHTQVLKFKEDDSLKVFFTLSENSLKGIQIKYQTEYPFESEKLKAELYDAESLDMLAKTEVLLKNERIQNKDGGSVIFLPLPLEEAMGKKVQLKLEVTGDSVHVLPSFLLSEKCVRESETYRNDTRVEGNLVFYALYSSGFKSNRMRAVGNGIWALLIGSFLYAFLNGSLFHEKKVDRSKTRHVLQRSKEFFRKAGSFLRAGKGILAAVVLLLCFLVLEVFFYQFGAEKAMHKKQTYEAALLEEEEDSFSGDSGSVRKCFSCNANYISAVSVEFSLKETLSNLKLVWKDETTGQILKEVSYAEGELKEGKNKKKLCLSDTLEKASGHRFSLTWTAEDARALSAEGVMVKLESGNVSFLRGFYFLIYGILLFVVVLCVYACSYSKWRMETRFLFSAFGFGVIFCILIGIGTVPDEPSHIDTVYQLSNEILGVEKSEKPGYIYKRAEDIDPLIESRQYLNVYHYERLWNHFFSMAEDETLVEYAVRNNLDNAGAVFYLPQAVGLSAARLLGLGYMPAMLLARLFSLAVYCLIVSRAIKWIPFGKTLLFLVAMLPISLQQAASFSYDAMINAVAFLYIACCLRLCYAKEKSIARDLIIVTVTGMLMAVVKGGVYLPLCLLLLLVFVCGDSAHGKRGKRGMGLLMAAFLFQFVKSHWAELVSRFSSAQGTVAGGAQQSEVYTLGYLLENPGRLLGCYMNTIFQQWDSYLRNILGGNLAWRDVNIAWILVLGIFLVLFLACLQLRYEKEWKLSERLVLFFICAGVYFCVELSMFLVWTPVTFDYITGVQGRYFLPVFLPFLFLAGTLQLKMEKINEGSLLSAMGILNCLAAMLTLQIVILR